MNGTSD